MPTYKVTDPDTGRTVKLTGDSPPTENELSEIFGELNKGVSESQQGKPNVLGNIFNRPAAVAREAIREKPSLALFGSMAGLMGLAQGSPRAREAAVNPSISPTFQNSMLQGYYNKVGTGIPQQIGGLGVSTLGLGADMATNPGEALTTLVGGKLLGMAGKTRAGQAVSRFMTKPRSFLRFGRDAVLDVSKKGMAGVDKLDDLAQTRYGNELAKIKGAVTDMTPIRNSIADVKAQYPDETLVQLNKLDKRLKDIKSLSASELKGIKEEIKKTVPKSVFQGKSEATPIQAAQLKVYNAVDDEIVKLGGDKYIAMKKEYSDWKNTAYDAYGILLEGGRPGDVKLRNWFGFGMSRRQRIALDKVSSLLPKDEQFMQQFDAWRRGQVAKTVGTGGGGVLLGDYLVRRAIGGIGQR